MKLNIKLKNLVRSMSLCCVIALSASFSATLQAETNPKQSQTQTLSKEQIRCLATNTYMEVILDKCLNTMHHLILIEG